VLDGDVLVRHVISDYLRTCGYVVIEAATTDEATVVLDEPTVVINAVLCDADAPGSRNSFQLRAWTAERHPYVQVALAGSIVAAANKAAQMCEDGPQLRRPYDPQSVVDHIKRLIGAAGADRLTRA
jgi:DNA-binding NtrC family response regulator